MLESTCDLQSLLSQSPVENKDIRKQGQTPIPHGKDDSLGGMFATLLRIPVTLLDTPGEMTELIGWIHSILGAEELHPLLIIAVFIVHFLAIHPFQDGNGRLSRILTTLLLLQQGYDYVPYCSLENIVERNKDKYYLSLRKAQKTLTTDDSGLEVWLVCFA